MEHDIGEHRLYNTRQGVGKAFRNWTSRRPSYELECRYEFCGFGLEQPPKEKLYFWEF